MLITLKISDPKWVKIFAILGVGLSLSDVKDAYKNRQS
jgi:hypothetical protein